MKRIAYGIEGRHDAQARLDEAYDLRLKAGNLLTRRVAERRIANAMHHLEEVVSVQQQAEELPVGPLASEG